MEIKTCFKPLSKYYNYRWSHILMTAPRDLCSPGSARHCDVPGSRTFSVSLTGWFHPGESSPKTLNFNPLVGDLARWTRKLSAKWQISHWGLTWDFCWQKRTPCHSVDQIMCFSSGCWFTYPSETSEQKYKSILKRQFKHKKEQIFSDIRGLMHFFQLVAGVLYVPWILQAHPHIFSKGRAVLERLPSDPCNPAGVHYPNSFGGGIHGQLLSAWTVDPMIWLSYPGLKHMLVR